MTTFPGGVFGNNQIAIPQITTGDPNTVSDATAKNPIGGKVRWNNQIWRYVKLDASDVAPVAGAPAYIKALTPAATATAVPVFTVTADESDTIAALQVVAVFGAFTTAPADKQFIFVMVGGVHPSAVATGAIAGDLLIGSTTDNVPAIIHDGTAPTNIPYGRVIGTSAAGLAPTLLMNMDW